MIELWVQHRGWLIALLSLFLLLAAAAVRLAMQRRQLLAAQTQLQHEKQHLADVIWGTDVGTWEWNVPTGEVAFNERWAEIIGYRLDELAPLSLATWNRLVHPEDLARSNELLLRCFRRETATYDCEVRMRHRDGHWVWIQDRGRVVEWTPDGKPLRMSGTHQDISARKENEATLAASEARLRTIFSIIPVGIALLDREGRVIECNAASERMLSLGRTGFLAGRPDGGEVGIYRPDGTPMPRSEYPSVRAFAEGRPVQDVVIEVRSAAGSLWLSVSATPIDHPRYGMVMAYVDITQLRAAETGQRLAASVFITHAREGIVITDADANIVDVNQAFTETTGYAREEVLGRNPRLLNSGWQTADFYAQMWRALIDQGSWQGEVWNRRKSGEIYPELLSISAVRDADGKVRHYVGLFSDISQIKSQQQQLEHIAHYDVLTDLPNRLLFAQHLHHAMTQAVRRGNQLAVIYLDLDGFKEINDQYGHNVGDSLLVTLAHRMRAVMRESDVLARLGGDEFAAILVDLDSDAECQPVLSRLLRAAADPVEIDDAVLRVSASIGYTLYPRDNADADQLLRHADQAMYSAKQLGKNCTCLFDVDQDAEVQSQRETIEHIRRALDRSEFVLHYQPRVEMKTGRVVGAEALIRWQHPQRGLVLPGEFLPVVEDRPLGVSIGEWVIDAALRQMDAWRRRGVDIPVSVNVASHQIQHPDFVAMLQESLAHYPEVSPTRLELEVLETSLLDDLMHARQIMNACRELGVRFALDDFGTGYSSLTYLRRLPAEILKIDQSFVRDMLEDPEDMAIVQGVLSLARAFRRDVVAEGVETIEHGELLILMGCECAQGFGIARPMPAAELEKWLQTWRPDPAWTRWRDRTVGPGAIPLLFALVEHRQWLSAVRRFLRGEGGELHSHLERAACRLCNPARNERLAGNAGDPALKDILARHEAMHRLADELMALHAYGKGAEVESGLLTLHGLNLGLTDALRRGCARSSLSNRNGRSGSSGDAAGRSVRV